MPNLRRLPYVYLVAHRFHSSLVCARPIELTSRAQIVLNAVTNAVKYTPPHAHAGVAVTARLGPAAASLLVEVADCGPGLRGQTLSQLVTEFGGIGSESARQGVIRSSGTGHPDVRDVR